MESLFGATSTLFHVQWILIKYLSASLRADSPLSHACEQWRAKQSNGKESGEEVSISRSATPRETVHISATEAPHPNPKSHTSLLHLLFSSLKFLLGKC